MTYEHRHHKGAFSTGRTRLAVVLIVMLVELGGGLLSRSIALIDDAGHMFVDVLALVLSLSGYVFCEEASYIYSNIWISAC